MRNKLAAILGFLGLVAIALFHPRATRAELHGPELDAAGK